VRFFKKIQDWILKSENGFCVSLLNRPIQDYSDHGVSKEPKNPCPE